MIQVRSAALVAALTLVLVGCSDDEPEPNADATPTTSTSLTPTPEPTPSKLSRTSVETVRRWVQARNMTLHDGGTTNIYALSTADCSTCRDLVEPVAQLYADGGAIETDGWKVDRARELPDSDKNPQVIAALTFAAGRTVHPGKAPSPFSEQRHVLQFHMRHTAQGWLVSQVVFLP